MVCLFLLAAMLSITINLQGLSIRNTDGDVNICYFNYDEILDQQNNGSVNLDADMHLHEFWFAQSFKTSQINKITKIGVQLSRTGGQNKNFKVEIWTNNIKDPGICIGSITLNTNIVGDSMEWVYADFSSSPISIVTGD
jgi:hypothetical protein